MQNEIPGGIWLPHPWSILIQAWRATNHSTRIETLADSALPLFRLYYFCDGFCSKYST